MPLFAKKILSWAVIVVSGLVGVLGLARFGSEPLPEFPLENWQVSILAAESLMAFVPLLASMLALFNKRRLAALLCLLVSPVFFRLGVISNAFELDLFSVHLYVWFAGSCLVLGLYWLFVWWRGWPTLLPHPLSIHRRILVPCLALFLIGTLSVVATFGFAVLRGWSVGSGECGLKGVFSRSTFGHDAAFTAHLFRVGHQVIVSDGWLGGWALAGVQERFWGWRFPQIVLLTGRIRSGDDYFIDGRRPKGLLTRFLPIVELSPCNRSARLAEAGVQLRILRSGFPKNDVRIIGRVIRWAGDKPRDYYMPPTYVLVQGVKVAVTGPGGTIVATTDREGIYDVGGLPPGRYKAQLENGDPQRSMAFFDYWSDLEAGQVAEYSFADR